MADRSLLLRPHSWRLARWGGCAPTSPEFPASPLTPVTSRTICTPEPRLTVFGGHWRFQSFLGDVGGVACTLGTRFSQVFLSSLTSRPSSAHQQRVSQGAQGQPQLVCPTAWNTSMWAQFKVRLENTFSNVTKSGSCLFQGAFLAIQPNFPNTCFLSVLSH